MQKPVVNSLGNSHEAIFLYVQLLHVVREMLIRDGVKPMYMSGGNTDTVIVNTDRGPLVIETTDTSLSTDDISLPDDESAATVETIIDYVRELATMHTVSMRCCDEEALIIVEDSYINTNVLTDLVATSSDVSFSTAIASGADTIEVTVSVTGDIHTQLVEAKQNMQLLSEYDTPESAV